MAASASIVPGSLTLTQPRELQPPALPAPAAPTGRAHSRLPWALLPAPFVGFVLGVALALAQAPPSAMPDTGAGAPPPVAKPRTRDVRPHFWKPAGSTAVAPALRLTQRHYRPELRLAGGVSLPR